LPGIARPTEPPGSVGDKHEHRDVPDDRTDAGNPVTARLIRLTPVNEELRLALVTVPIALKI
jgi:hypothetical protein